VYQVKAWSYPQELTLLAGTDKGVHFSLLAFNHALSTVRHQLLALAPLSTFLMFPTLFIWLYEE